MVLKKRVVIWLAALAVYTVLIFSLVQMEKRIDDASIRNFSDGLWYAIVTLTTVGYGDVYPKTAGGKLIGLVFVFSSLGLIGILISKISESLANIRERRKMGLTGTTFKNHVVIVGWNRLAQKMALQVMAAGKKIAVITNRKDDIDLIYEQFPRGEVFVLLADFMDVDNWEKANLKESTAVFLNLPQDTDKLVCILNLKKKAQDLHIVVNLDNEDLKETFYNAGVTFAVGKEALSAKILASYTFEPDVAEFNEDLLSSTETDLDFDIKQYKVLPENPYVGRRFIDLFIELKRGYNTILIGLVTWPEGKRVLLKNPPDDTLVASGDYLICILNKGAAQKLSQDFGVPEGRLIF